MCERDHLFFSRYFFKHRQAIKFRVNWHHELIAEKVQGVIDGRIKNLVINVPPGSSKTELVAINLMARGLALNPRARFLHISYSDDLALLNSQTAKELVQSDEFQELWPLKVAADAKSKKRWNIEVDGRKAGGVYAVSLGGQITGFRAGHMAEGWQGAIVIDDPLKVGDAYSKPRRAKANRDLIATVKSRRANPDTPIIVIMQRLAQEDVTGFIEAGNLGPDWEQVVIPALIDDSYVAGLPAELQAKVDRSVRDEKGRFSYWPYKEPLAELLAMEAGAGADQEGGRVSRYVFSAQYQQRPAPLGGDLIKGAWFGRYAVPPRIIARKVFADTAQKDGRTQRLQRFRVLGPGRRRQAVPAGPASRQMASAGAQAAGAGFLGQEQAVQPEAVGAAPTVPHRGQVQRHWPDSGDRRRRADTRQGRGARQGQAHAAYGRPELPGGRPCLYP